MILLTGHNSVVTARKKAAFSVWAACLGALGSTWLWTTAPWLVAAEGIAGEVVELPLDVQVALQDGKPVADEAFVEAHLDWANQVFERYGVHFSLHSLGTYEGTVAMESRGDRDSLAPHVHEGVINCFVVASLMDVDEPGRVRRGVHWHAEAVTRAHYVILSAIAQPFVLAHELGHFLGNPRHSPTPGNLMSYTRRPGLPFLDAKQLARLKRRLQRYLREGELVPMKRDL